MKAYRTHITIDNPERVIIPNLPFISGQRVEVVVLADEEDRGILFKELQSLLKETQSLPRSRFITEEEVASEIAACRSEKKL